MLLVQEDRRFWGGETTRARRADAEAQLVAKAGAFSWNNRQRGETGQPLLESQACAGHLLD